MEVEFSLTLQDCQAFVLHGQKKPAARAGGRWRRESIWILLFVALAGWIVLGQPGQPNVARFVEVIYPGVIGAALGAYAVSLLYARHNRFLFQNQKEYIEDPRNRWFFDPRRVTVSPEGYTSVSGVQRFFNCWSIIHEIEATAEYAFFWTNTDSAYIIPARAFRSHQEFEDFVALARRYQQGWDGRPSQAITTDRAVPSTDIFRPDSP
jgi:hypothetical protein